MRFDNLHWTPIDEPAKTGFTFKELNSESSEPRFVDLQDNVVEESTNPEENEKLKFQLNKMLESYMHIRGKKLIKEDAHSSSEILSHGADIKSDDKRMQHDFFTGKGRPGVENGDSEWHEFERHVEIITSFMDIDKTQLKEMLDAIKKSFIALASLENPGGWSMEPGEGMLNAGFRKLSDLDRIFDAAGLKGLEPEIRASKFLEILSPYYKEKNTRTGKMEKKRIDKPKDGGKNFEYDIASFIKMLETRSLEGKSGKKARALSSYLSKDGPYNLGSILETAIRSTQRNSDATDGINMKKIIEVFRKVVNQGGYSKNNAQVGKGEIALAMFFGDCRLPSGKGDIEIQTEEGWKKVEVKGNDAGITERTTIIDMLLGTTWQEAQNLMKGHDAEIKNILNSKEYVNNSE